MSLLLIDLAYFSIKSVGYIGYYVYKGVSYGINTSMDYFYPNNTLLIKDDEDEFVLVDENTKLKEEINSLKNDLSELRNSLTHCKQE